MKFYRQLLPVSTEIKTKRKIIKELTKTYKPILEDTKEKILAGLGKSRNGSLNINSGGELFRDSDGIFFYFAIPENQAFIEIGCLTPREQDNSESLERFKSIISGVIHPEAEYSPGLWKNYKTSNPRFRQLKEAATPLLPTADDISLVNDLENPSLRLILQEVASDTNCFMENLVKKFEQEDVFELVDKLVNLGLLTREYFVFCRETNRQISRVLDIDFIKDASSRGLRCPYCAKTFVEEKVDQGLNLTERGLRFSKVNLWLALYVLIYLNSEKIHPTDILVKTENNFANLELFVNYKERLIHIGLKENKASLNEIYMFTERLTIYKPDIAVLVCAQPLADEASRYLTKGSHPVILIDSIDKIKEKFSEILTTIQYDYISDSLAPFQELTKVRLDEIISDYFLQDKQKSLSSTISEISKSQTEHKKSYEEQVKEIMGRDYVPEKLPKEEVEISFSPLKAADKSPTEQEAPADDLSPEAQDAVMAAAETIQPIPDGTQPSVSQEEESVEYIVDDEEEVENYILEETIGLGFNNKSNVFIPEFSQTEILKNETRKKITRELSDFLATHSIVENSQALQPILDALANAENMSACLSDKEGLIIASSNEEKEPDETITAYGTALFYNVREKTEIQHLFIDWEMENLTMTPMGEQLLLIADYDNAQSGDELAIATEPSGLRDSIAGKIFEELASIDNVNGCQLVSEEGNLLIQTKDPIKTSVMELLTGFWKTNKTYIAKINKMKPKQICFFLADAIYSFIPFEDGSVFVVSLDNNTIREIWNLKIKESARMLA